VDGEGGGVLDGDVDVAELPFQGVGVVYGVGAGRVEQQVDGADGFSDGVGDCESDLREFG
jgi:hypothetical protein